MADDMWTVREQEADYVDVESLYGGVVFDSVQREQLMAAHRAGGLQKGEIADRRRTALPLIAEIEEYTDARYPQHVDDVNDYMDWVFDDAEEYPSFFEHDKLVTVSRHLPEIAAFYGDAFDPLNFARNIHPDGYWSTKPAEYLLRSAPVWEDTVNGVERTRVVETLLDRAEHPHRIVSQYLPTTIDLVPETLSFLEEQVYPRMLEPGAPRARALAATPLPALAEQLPREDARALEEEIDAAWEEAVAIDGIRPRLRGMANAGSCGNLEPRHWETFLADEPSKETILIRMEDTLVGSLKLVGSRSMLALRDVRSGERYTLQKGYTYKIPQRIWKNRGEAEEHRGWYVLDVEDLQVSPLRRAGKQGDYTVEQFRERVDERVDELDGVIT